LLKKGEVRGDQRKLHISELRYFCFLPNIMQVTKSRMCWAGHVTCSKKRNAYVLLVGKTWRPFGRPRHRWEVNRCIKMDLKEIGWGDMDWTYFGSG
jgi:hypothetical protein